MRRVALIIAVGLAVAGLALALLPFDHPPRNGTFLSATSGLSSHCSPPVVSAWQSEDSGGWFGYAPLSKPLMHFSAPYCRPAARTRLEYTGGLWLGAVLVLLARRRQWPRNAVPRIAPA